MFSEKTKGILSIIAAFLLQFVIYYNCLLILINIDCRC